MNESLPSDHDDPTRYGQQAAQLYDELYQERSQDLGLESFLARRAGSGPVLELAIGTGRVASRLRRLGVDVFGVDVSLEMLRKCRERVPDVPVVLLDARELSSIFRLRPTLIYCTMGTLFQLGRLEDQQKVLSSAAKCASPDGLLCIDAWQPPSDLSVIPAEGAESRITGGRSLSTITRHDMQTHSVSYRQVVVSDDEVDVIERRDFYFYPDQVASFAAEVGWQLSEAWADFRENELTPDSPWFVHVYQRES